MRLGDYSRQAPAVLDRRPARDEVPEDMWLAADPDARRAVHLDRPVTRLDMLSADERTLILTGWARGRPGKRDRGDYRSARSDSPLAPSRSWSR